MQKDIGKFDETIRVQIARISEQAKRLMHSHFATYGLTENEVRTLIFFAFSGKNTAKEMAEKFQFSRSLVSKTVDALVKKNLLSPLPSQTDRRTVHLTLTDAARDIVQKLNETRDDLQAKILQNISNDELKVVQSVLQKVSLNLEELSK